MLSMIAENTLGILQTGQSLQNQQLYDRKIHTGLVTEHIRTKM